MNLKKSYKSSPKFLPLYFPIAKSSFGDPIGLGDNIEFKVRYRCFLWIKSSSSSLQK